MLLALVLSACVSNPSTESSSPTLKEIQAMKPDVFKADVPPLPSNCTLIPLKVTDIVGTDYYVLTPADRSFSIIDPVRKAKNDLETAPLVQYGDKLNAAARDSKAGKCIVAYIDDWARNDALLGSMRDSINPNHALPMGRVFQKWLLAEAAANYLKFRQSATGDQDERIKWWMTQVANSVKAFFDNAIKDPGFTKQNHYAWAGAAVMEVGVITDNQEFVDWGRKVFEQQMADVSADGTLPLELARGKMALKYHNLALHALMYMAELSKMVGEDWTTNPNLHRLITLTTNANLDPTILQKLNGQSQYPDNQTGWANLLPDDDQNRAKLAKYGFPDVVFLGGNQLVMRNLIERIKK